MATASQLLPVPAGPMPKVTMFSAIAFDVALLADGLRLDGAAAGESRDLRCQDLGRALVGADHVDDPVEHRAVDGLAALGHHDHLLEDPRHDLGLVALDGDLVAADVDARRRRTRPR